MTETNSYEDAVEIARRDRQSLQIAIATNPLVYLVLVLAMVAIFFYLTGRIQYSAATSQRSADNVAIYRLTQGEKALAKYGFKYDSDAKSEYLILSAPNVKAYIDSCDGRLCVRIYRTSNN